MCRRAHFSSGLLTLTLHLAMCCALTNISSRMHACVATEAGNSSLPSLYCPHPPVLVHCQQPVLLSCQLTQLCCLCIGCCHGLLQHNIAPCLQACLGKAVCVGVFEGKGQQCTVSARCCVRPVCSHRQLRGGKQLAHLKCVCVGVVITTSWGS